MAETVLMPKLGFDMSEGVLVRWVKSESETIKKGEVLAEIETDKATVEVESEYEGVVFRHLVSQDDVVPVGNPIAVIASADEDLSTIKIDELKPKSTGGDKLEKKDESQQKTQVSNETKKEPEKPQKESEEDLIVRASPLAKSMAKDHGVDINLITGSGPSGRVVKKDVEEYLASSEHVSSEKIKGDRPSEITAQVRPILFKEGIEIPEDETIKVSRLRKAIGKRMQESKQTIPHFYVTHKYDVKKLVQLRRDLNELLEGKKLSINDFIVKATALALRHFPNLNASLRKDEIIRYGHVNIGVAVAVDDGLLTVVCRDADKKSLLEISDELKSMVKRVRSGKVKAEDIEGSTFSISNLGMYDVEEFVAIINPPEAAILAVGSAKPGVIVVDEKVVPSVTLNVTLSADHRLSDGAEAAKFLQVLGSYIEKPLSLLF